MGEQALRYFQVLFSIEEEVAICTPDERRRIRQRKSRRVAACVFRTIVTDRFGIVTADFGNVTGHFGDVTDGVLDPV